MFRGGPIHHLFEVQVLQPPAGDEAVVVAHEIHAAELNRVDTQALGDRIDLHLAGKGDLGHARGPKCAGRHRIRIDGVSVGADVGEPIETRHLRRDVARSRR